MVDRLRQNLIADHQEWMGFVQPVGLVVAPTVMVDAQVIPDRNISGRQREFRQLLEESGRGATARWRAPDIRRLFVELLGWSEDDLVVADTAHEILEVSLPELQVVLSATWAVPADYEQNNQWMMLIRVEPSEADLDKAPDEGDTWNATRHARFERLLREKGIPIGLLCSDEVIRLIYAPQGETSGHITFDFSEMAQTAGRPILAAFEMLLSADTLFGGTRETRLPALLEKSREAQAEVSTQLSRQVLSALYELLRGFIAADARRSTGHLAELAKEDPNHLYGGLITALMRLVFILYAEDRDLMSDHPVYQQHYSLGGLFSRLRADAAAWPDTMDQRFGAWAQLLALFRLVHGGGRHDNLVFVARQGSLFNPERFPFLEGRTPDGEAEIPMVPDATVWNVLQNLMMLDGERLSYRTLDVEQIGSVYEAIMGFRIEVTSGRSIAVRSQKRTGAAVVVDLGALLNVDAVQRVSSLQNTAGRTLADNESRAFKAAKNPEEMVAAIDRKVDRDATPDILPAGVPVLQPTDERRRSGSHYTPRSLTEPIVLEALRPVLERLGLSPRPEEILELKVLDPAIGSGAFLVETCRQLSARLVEAWNVHGRPNALSKDEDELIHARRLIAQRCLYGVDKNPMAVDLARLSLWLATLAKNHEFTFLDHALRHGDSLVGLTRRQIEGFHWKMDASPLQLGTESIPVRKHVERVSQTRQVIREMGVQATEQELLDLLAETEGELQSVRQFGGLVLGAFFGEEKQKQREDRRKQYASLIIQHHGNGPVVALAEEYLGIEPFHWEIEFPEVFDRETPGFDAIVGNPPFAGKNTIGNSNPSGYMDWLKEVHPESHGNADLVAHFYRRSFDLLRQGGTFGLIATNTIGQGDTRSTGLRWICKNGGEIYDAQRRIKWPGEAAVVVSVVHVTKGPAKVRKRIDGKEVDMISAFLFHDGNHDDPVRLAANSEKSFQGSIVLGMGFTFDDSDTKGVATSISEMARLIESNPRNQEVIFPYIGGEEVNNHPNHAFHRYVINFHDRNLTDAMKWPDLLQIVRENVKPERDVQKRKALRERWWQYAEKRPGLVSAINGLSKVLVINCGATPHHAFAFLPARMVFANTLAVFPFETYAAFAALQSRPHEIWARFFASSMKDDLRYTPSDCFETFPFPEGWEKQSLLERSGKEYYQFRAKFMVANNEGLTKTYNRFHDPEERNPKIAELRRLHAAMDRAVLDAYGWADISTDCEFLLDYEIDEEEWGRKKRPWRYRWPDEVRDRVLARLMALNGQRAQKERLAGLKS